jgi:RNA polymerase sigma-70 factor (ECF subfamily)
VAARHPLSALFLPACPPEGAPPAGPALEALLAGALARARAAWPGVSVADDAFLRYLAVRTRAPDALERLRIEDLYVACACVHKSPRGIAAVDARYFPEIDGALRKMSLPTAKIEDVKQALRHQLFVGAAGEAPRIAQYDGAGDLKAWLRVTAVRAALKVIRKDKREAPSGDEALFEGTAGASSDPELAYIKHVYRDRFKAAFQASLDALDDREKTLLRQSVVDGLSIDELSSLHGVHRATVARWLAKAKETLLDGTRKHFMQSARISKNECESILRLVQSQLDATIRRRLEGA